MELLHLQYHVKGIPNKQILLLYLGQNDNKICGILSESINNDELKLIKSNKIYLSQLPFIKKIEWFKSKCPYAFKKGYRTIITSNLTIINRHVI